MFLVFTAIINKNPYCKLPVSLYYISADDVGQGSRVNKPDHGRLPGVLGGGTGKEKTFRKG